MGRSTYLGLDKEVLDCLTRACGKDQVACTLRGDEALLHARSFVLTVPAAAVENITFKGTPFEQALEWEKCVTLPRSEPAQAMDSELQGDPPTPVVKLISSAGKATISPAFYEAFRGVNPDVDFRLSAPTEKDPYPIVSVHLGDKCLGAVGQLAIRK